MASARLDTPPTWRYTFCHERQIALIYDGGGSLVPLLKHTKSGAALGGDPLAPHEREAPRPAATGGTG